MVFDKKLFIPSPSTWFSTNIEYQGHGQAKFLDPPGIIQGKTTIRFDEFGESSIEMEVEDIQTEQRLEFGLIELLSGNKPVRAGGAISLGFGGTENPCIELKVVTSVGIFSANDHIHCGFQIAGSGSKIKFSILRPQFDVTNAEEAQYWVIPLSNFISNFRQAHPNLNNHPLRIYPTPAIPEDLPNEEKTNAKLIANQKNHLIIFEFGDSLGFIEPLPDFDERKGSLFAHRASTK